MESSTNSTTTGDVKKKIDDLGPATMINNKENVVETTSADEGGGGVEDTKKKKPDLVKTVKSLDELNNALQRYLIFHPRSEAVFNFKGDETLDEIISALFVFEQQQANGTTTLDDAEKERKYQILMNELKAVGYDQENTPPLRHHISSPFESTEDLLNCLVDESPKTTTPTTIMMTVNKKGNVENKKHHTSKTSAAAVDKPKSSQFSLSDLLEQTGGDIMVDPESSFNDIQLEQQEVAMDLDEVEGADLLQPPSIEGRTRRPSSGGLALAISLLDSSNDSFHSAETTLSTSPTHFLPKNKSDDIILPSTSFDCTTTTNSKNITAIVGEDMIDNKKTPPKLVKVVEEVDQSSNGSGLTKDDLGLIKRFGLSPCSVRLEYLLKKKEEKNSKEEEKESESEEVEVEEIDVVSFTEPPILPPRKTTKGGGSDTSSNNIRRMSPRKSIPTWKKSQSNETNTNKVLVAAVGGNQNSTGKTRIKARKPTDEELLQAAASSLTPEEVILRRLTTPVSPLDKNDQVTKARWMFGARSRNIKSEPQLGTSSSLELGSGNDEPNQKQDQNIPIPIEDNPAQEKEKSVHKNPTQQPPSGNIVQQAPAADVNPIPLSHSDSTTAMLEKEEDLSQAQSDCAHESLENIQEESVLTVVEAVSATTLSSSSTPVSSFSGGTNSSRPPRVSIEHELDDLLGVIPVFDIDDDDDDDEVVDVCNVPWYGLNNENEDMIEDELVDILSNQPTTQQLQPAQPFIEPLNNEVVEEKHSIINTTSASCDEGEILEITDLTTESNEDGSVNKSQSPSLSHSTEQEEETQNTNIVKSKSKPSSSKKSTTTDGPGPKSKKTKMARESLVDEGQSESPIANSNEKASSPPSNPTKRRKISHSTSSSESVDAYLPLVESSTEQKTNNNLPPSAPSERKEEKIILVDVNEDMSSSSEDEEDENSSYSDAEMEDMDDLFAILPPKPSEKARVLELQEEWGKSKLNEIRLIDLMDKTRSYRKRFLEANNFDIDLGMKVFPAMKNYKIVKAEYNQLNPGIVGGRMAKLEKELKDSLNNATNVKKRPGQKRHALWERALQNSKNPTSLSIGLKRVLGMICLCFHLAENHAATNLLHVLKRGEHLDWRSISTPRIVCYEDELESEEAKAMYIYAEGQKFLKVPNIYDGVLTVYALHYVFSVEYLASLRPLFKHFDSLAKIKT